VRNRRAKWSFKRRKAAESNKKSVPIVMCQSYSGD